MQKIIKSLFLGLGLIACSQNIMAVNFEQLVGRLSKNAGKRFTIQSAFCGKTDVTKVIQRYADKGILVVPGTYPLPVQWSEYKKSYMENFFQKEGLPVEKDNNGKLHLTINGIRWSYGGGDDLIIGETGFDRCSRNGSTPHTGDRQRWENFYGNASIKKYYTTENINLAEEETNQFARMIKNNNHQPYYIEAFSCDGLSDNGTNLPLLAAGYHATHGKVLIPKNSSSLKMTYQYYDKSTKKIQGGSLSLNSPFEIQQLRNNGNLAGFQNDILWFLSSDQRPHNIGADNIDQHIDLLNRYMKRFGLYCNIPHFYYGNNYNVWENNFTHQYTHALFTNEVHPKINGSAHSIRLYVNIKKPADPTYNLPIQHLGYFIIHYPNK